MRIAVAALMGLAVHVSAQSPPPLPREARAVWVATVNNIDWPTSKTLTPAQQRSEAIALLDLAKNLNFNIVVLQVRPAADAIYPSPFDPWTPYLTNSMGTPPSDGYDPLQFWVDEARARGLELHAWINPYRALASTSVVTSPGHITQTHPSVVKTYGTAVYMDPGHPFSRERTLSVVADLTTRYDLDGIHIDDYFYPYPIANTAFPDDDTYGDYTASGGSLSRADWRRENVNAFVQRMYATVKLRKPWVKVGISPFGIWRPGNPPGVTGLDAYASIYADSKKWLNNGWLDYMSPQLYWKVSASGQPYAKLLTWWVQQNLAKRHLWPGNFTSNVGSQYGDWPVQEILDQIDLTRLQRGSTGNVHFSARALRGNWKGIADSLRSTRYSNLALVPASPWLDDKAPAPPLNDGVTVNLDTMRLRWRNGASEEVRQWVVSTRYGLKWRQYVLGPDTLEYIAPRLQGGLPLIEFQVQAVDRVGNVSAPMALRLRR